MKAHRLKQTQKDMTPEMVIIFAFLPRSFCKHVSITVWRLSYMLSEKMTSDGPSSIQR